MFWRDDYYLAGIGDSSIKLLRMNHLWIHCPIFSVFISDLIVRNISVKAVFKRINEEFVAEFICLNKQRNFNEICRFNQNLRIISTFKST